MSTVTTPSPRPIRFGAFEVDLKAGELRKGGVRIKLQGQPFEILLMLLERPGELVERERLREHLWPTDTFVDFDHGVNSAINRLREALGDSADSPRFVETVPRRGYRFVAPVEAPAAAVVKTNALVAELSSSAATPAETPQPSPIRRRSRKRATAAPIVIAVVLIAALIFRPVRERIFGRFNPPRIQCLAVLPLTNLSNNAEQDFFADGMTEALTTDLGKISALRVISRTSVMQYLGVARTVNPKAHDNYLRGHRLCNNDTREGLDQGIRHLQQAIEDDPNDPLGYAGLADCYGLHAWAGDIFSGDLTPKDTMPLARDAATRALQLDDSLAEAHMALANVKVIYDWNWPAAETEFKRAIQLNPNSSEAHMWYAHF